MADACCAPETPLGGTAVAEHCPGCGKPGRPVGLRTVQSQVAYSLRVLAASPYQFCATQRCAVVYYTTAAPPITCDQLREHVFQKAPGGAVLVCYCFHYRVDVIQQSDRAARAAILADIVAGTRQEQCACALRNPQGSCCLGNVRRLLRMSEPNAIVEVEKA